MVARRNVAMRWGDLGLWLCVLSMVLYLYGVCGRKRCAEPCLCGWLVMRGNAKFVPWVVWRWRVLILWGMGGMRGKGNLGDGISSRAYFV